MGLSDSIVFMGIWGLVVCGVVMFLIGLFCCWFFMVRVSKKKVVDSAADLKGDEKRLYDILIKGDGVGWFGNIVLGGFGKKKLGVAVRGLKEKGILKERVFSHKRKLWLVDYLNAREREVLEFVGSRKRGVEFCVIMKKLGIDDNMLTRIGKKLVKMGKIVKVARGYGTYFVLVRK